MGGMEDGQFMLMPDQTTLAGIYTTNPTIPRPLLLYGKDGMGRSGALSAYPLHPTSMGGLFFYSSSSLDSLDGCATL